MRKVLFIDRDGTLIREPKGTFQVDSLDLLEFLPGVIRNLYKIVTEMDYELVLVTNQDGLGTPSYPQAAFDAVQNKMLQILASEGIAFSSIHIDGSFPEEKKDTRKPGLGMLGQYLQGEYDMSKSFVIGDRTTDIQLALNLGAGAVFIENYDSPEGYENHLACNAKNWDEVYAFLVPKRQAQVQRKTNETDITVQLNLDGKGIAKVSTGLGFFDHMLEQIARHGQLDLTVEAKGDLHIDEHHTIEDTGIALGECFAKALGNKRGIERYGFCLPMDDGLAQVALDFGGRNWLVWEAEFKREKVGDVPTEMFSHFFKSFSDSARCNLNVQAEGENEHHKIESIFKAFAKALKMAVKKEQGNNSLPSTKGIL
jgi:imidazoleglycerol-phosphate dehydratase/histidinol-phosphatase